MAERQATTLSRRSIRRIPVFFFALYAYHGALHSFPTRRSSDLLVKWQADQIEKRRADHVLSHRPHEEQPRPATGRDRKSTRLNSSHQITSYAVFCLKKKNCSRSRPSPAPIQCCCSCSRARPIQP